MKLIDYSFKKNIIFQKAVYNIIKSRNIQNLNGSEYMVYPEVPEGFDFESMEKHHESVWPIFPLKITKWNSTKLGDIPTDEEINQEIANINLELEWNKVREKRNKLLTDSDWTQVTDNSLNETKREEWRTYRQQLRDITENQSDPYNIVWPTKPS